MDEGISLFRAIELGDLSLVQRIIENKKEEGVIDFNAVTEEGTIINYAVENGTFEIVEYLINCEINLEGSETTPLININFEFEDGLTPLMTACIHQKPEIVELLIKKGAALELKDDEGDTALVYAVIGGSSAIIEDLLNAGANINVKNNDGYTPLHKSCMLSNRDLVNLFIRRGANLEIKDDDGDTPLLTACAYGNMDIVSDLLDAGADTYVKNNNQHDIFVIINNNLTIDERGKDIIMTKIDMLRTSTMYKPYDIPLDGGKKRRKTKKIKKRSKRKSKKRSKKSKMK